MSEFVVSARKYRPSSFETVVGQESITSTLESAISSGQMAQAYLFCGPRGVGKTSCARIFARVINQESLGENEDLSFNVFELDAASNNSVEDIRYITDQVRIPPQVGKYKVYIIDEVHMLSSNAFNAFLKTLEEPPPHAIFILATTEKHKIIPTILSRCQVYNFNRIQVEDMVKHLEKIAEKEGVTYEREALYVIAEKADGALRDSLSIFDQIVNFSNKNITYKSVIDNLNVLDYNYYFKIVEAINSNNIANSLLIFDDILSYGFDGHHFISGLGSHFRDLLVSKDYVTIKLLEVGETVKKRYLEQCQETDIRLLVKGLEILSDADIQYKTSKNTRLLVELTLIKLCSLTQSEQKKNLVISDSDSATKESPVIIPTTSPKKEEVAIVAEPIQETPKLGLIEEPVQETLKEEKVPLEPIKPEETKALPPKEDRKKVVFGSSFSIKDTMKKHNDIKEEIEKTDADEFTLEQLMECWNTYAKGQNEKGRKTLFTALTKNNPELMENFTIVHTLENKTLSDNFDRQKQDISDYLKKELNNYSISIQSKLIKSEKEELFLYTDKEKFKKIAEDHPELIYLKDKLHLDFEF